MRIAHGGKRTSFTARCAMPGITSSCNPRKEEESDGPQDQDLRKIRVTLHRPSPCGSPGP